jgi:hypothetical protein
MGHTLLIDAALGPISKVAANKDAAKTVPKKQYQEYELINKGLVPPTALGPE